MIDRLINQDQTRVSSGSRCHCCPSPDMTSITWHNSQARSHTASDSYRQPQVWIFLRLSFDFLPLEIAWHIFNKRVRETTSCCSLPFRGLMFLSFFSWGRLKMPNLRAFGSFPKTQSIISSSSSRTAASGLTPMRYSVSVFVLYSLLIHKWDSSQSGSVRFRSEQSRLDSWPSWRQCLLQRRLSQFISSIKWFK